MSLEDRVQILKEQLRHAEPEGQLMFVSLECNHCGRYLTAPDHSVLFAEAKRLGWSVGENFGDQDICGGCLG